MVHNRRTHAHTYGHTDRLTHTHALTHTETVLNARAPLATDNKLVHTHTHMHTRKLNTGSHSHTHTHTHSRNGSRSGSRSRRCRRSRSHWRCHKHTHRHRHGHERRDSATPLRSWHCLALCRKRQLTAQPETGTPTESVASPKLPARRRWKRTAGTTNPKLLPELPNYELRTIAERTNIFMQQTIGCPSASSSSGSRGSSSSSRSWGC